MKGCIQTKFLIIYFLYVMLSLSYQITTKNHFLLHVGARPGGPGRSEFTLCTSPVFTASVGSVSEQAFSFSNFSHSLLHPDLCPSDFWPKTHWNHWDMLFSSTDLFLCLNFLGEAPKRMAWAERNNMQAKLSENKELESLNFFSVATKGSGIVEGNGLQQLGPTLYVCHQCCAVSVLPQVYSVKCSQISAMKYRRLLCTEHSFSTSSSRDLPEMKDEEREEPASVELHNPIAWHNEELPAWAYEEYAVQIILYVMEWNADPLVKIGAVGTRVLAFVWRYAFCATLLLWVFWGLFPFIVTQFAACDEQGGFSQISSCFLILYVPVLALSLWLEWKIMAVKLPLEILSVGGWTIAGIKIPFVLYAAMQMCKSALGHLDLATNGIVFAEILHTASCPTSHVDEMWALVGKHSRFGDQLPHLSVCVSISYGLMVLQLILALYSGTPFYANNNPRVKQFSFWFWMEPPKIESKDDVPQSPYAITLFSWPEEVWAPELVLSLGHAGRLSMVVSRETERIKATRLRTIQQLDGADPWTRASLATWARLITTRVLLSTCFEGAFFTNIQSSSLAIEKALTGKEDALTIASLILSCLVFAEQLFSAVKAVYAIVAALWPYLDDARMTEQDMQFQEQGYTEMNRSSLKGNVIRTVLLLAVSMILMSWWMSYAVLKTIMVFYCEQGMWNFAWPLASGCVDTH